ncbi:MAG: DUF1080 domain-containing protein [Acidobacteria bacterium]|nr:DUF1080 domain-containing protein [Acidobacteriota bacterium]
MRERFGRRPLLIGLTGAAFSQDWQTLFDGTTPTGWIEVTGKPFPENCWKIEDGCLKSLPVKPTFQDIRTIRTFRDFSFAFEWRIAPGGNSGVKYLIEKFDTWSPKGVQSLHARARGPEYQLTDDEASEEAKRDPSKGTASLYGKAAALAAPIRRAGEWNESMIVVRRPVVEHWLNGRKVLETEIRNGVESSAIALQNHSSECWFRSLRIKE